MIPCTIHYEFIQKFNVSAQRAFVWCTDYRPDDMKLMKEENATRRVQRIANNVMILFDTFADNERKGIEKQKLVCIYPNRLTWTSTHLTGPNKHSQFIYELTALPEGKSQLKFTALSLDNENRNKEDTERKRKAVRKMDAEKWKLLAEEMEKDIC